MQKIQVEKIIRSRRRTIALEITPAATLIVRAPLRAPSEYIEEIIRQKSSWIVRKFDEMKRRPLSSGHEYAEGEIFLFLGREYPLHIIPDGNMTIERSDKLYVSGALLPDIKNQIKRWYREEAHKEIPGPVHVVFYENRACPDNDQNNRCTATVGFMHPQRRTQFQLAPDPGPAGYCGLRCGARTGSYQPAGPFPEVLEQGSGDPAGL